MTFATAWLHVGARMMEDRLVDLVLVFDDAGERLNRRPLTSKLSLTPRWVRFERDRQAPMRAALDAQRAKGGGHD